MTRDQKIAPAQTELRKHDFSTYIENPPSIANGGSGVVVPGCPHCAKRLSTISQFIEHLAVDVVPEFFDEEFRLREPGIE